MADEKSGNAVLVRELADILRANDLTEIELESDDVHIRLSRSAPAAVQVASAAPVSASPPASTGPVDTAPQASGAAVGSAPAAAVGPSGDVIASPMVGTAYLSSTPGSPPFVKEGQTVKEGDTLLIIEAMKVMNAIPAPRSGKIVEVLCENAQPVEFDQPLMIIE